MNGQHNSRALKTQQVAESSEETQDKPVATLLSDRLSEVALAYHNLGLNVMPQPLRSKGGLPWKHLQVARLTTDDLQAITDYAGECNLAVFTGRTSGNLFILDCENSEVLGQQCRQLQRRDIPLWVSVSNSSDGGGHVWLRCAEGEIANISLKTLPDMEIRGQRNYIIVPPSIHPEGTYYTWDAINSPEIPVVSLKRIDWLPLSLAHATPKATQRREKYNRDARDFIADGAPEGTRNTRLLRAARSVLCWGDDPDEVLREAALRSGLSNREIDGVLSSADSYPTPIGVPNRKSAHDWQRAVAWGQAHRWEGRTATTDKRVWAALCERARCDGRNGVFRASTREIAELARVQRGTATKSMKRFEAKDLIVGVTDASSHARLFKFGRAVPNMVVDASVQVAVALKESALVEQRAFGVNGLAVYRYLCQHGPQTQVELQRACRLSREQVRVAIRKLVDIEARVAVVVIAPLTHLSSDSGMFSTTHRQVRKWRAFPLTDVEEGRMASQLGVVDAADKRKQLHEKERSARARNLIEAAIDGKRKRGGHS